MPEQGSDPFSAGGVFGANPHLYDYVHSLAFTPAGTVEMVDGAGQVINTLIKARFSAEPLDATSFHVTFMDIVEVDPYYHHKHMRIKRMRDSAGKEFIKVTGMNAAHEESDVRSRPDPFSVTVTREESTFAIRQQVIWSITDEQDWPYLLYRVRYRFSSDPLERFRANRQGNLYFQIEAPDPDTRLYYRAQDRQKRTARELAREGIPIADAQS
jgi:hypothetical protein